nr:MAG TPA: hypothetical protein [Caudoviricetes sp.]
MCKSPRVCKRARGSASETKGIMRPLYSKGILMLPVAKIIISGLSSIGAGMIASKLTKPLVSNANGIAKILLWFGSVGTGVAASAIVAREVELQFDATVKAVQEARDHVEIED